MLAMILIVIFATAGLDNWMGKQDASWAAWMFKQKQKMISQPGDRRLIIVAGSNGLFGINAAQLERETSYRAINAATHAGLSLKFTALTLLNLTRPGDIVLMPLEYDTYYRSDPLDSFVVQVAHRVGIQLFLALNLNQKLNYIRLLPPVFIMEQLEQSISPKVASRRFQRMSNLGYWKFGLGDQGDVDLTSAKPKPQAVLKADKVYQRLPIRADQVDEESQELCGAIQSLTGRGVRVIGTPENVYMSEMATIDSRHAVLAKAKALFKRCGGEWLDVPSEGLQSIDHMLDTVFHLNEEGRRLRTQELASALCARALVCPSPPKS